MAGEFKLTVSLERGDAVTLLQHIDRQLHLLRAEAAAEGSEPWADSIRERMALFIVKLALEASLCAPAARRKDA